MARLAAEWEGERAGRDYLQEASLSHFIRKTTETHSEATSAWTRDHMGRKHRYRPPGGEDPKGLAKVRKELAGRFYQLLSGHAATAEHLMRIGQALNDKCWWCGSGERQTRFHLFGRCQRWGPEIEMWAPYCGLQIKELKQTKLFHSRK